LLGLSLDDGKAEYNFFGLIALLTSACHQSSVIDVFPEVDSMTVD
jgi:hypothetical protein